MGKWTWRTARGLCHQLYSYPLKYLCLSFPHKSNTLAISLSKEANLKILLQPG